MIGDTIKGWTIAVGQRVFFLCRNGAVNCGKVVAVVARENMSGVVVEVKGVEFGLEFKDLYTDQESACRKAFS